MDPLLFGVKGDVVANVLGMIVLLSLVVERALSPFFEWRVILERTKEKGVKEPIALVVSFLVVYYYKFDALAVVFSQDKSSLIGYLITAAVVAGGSKGSIKLFRDFLGWKSTAQKDYEDAKKKAPESVKQA